jgi:hypothetical protein
VIGTPIAKPVLNVVKETTLKIFQDLPASKNSKERREAKMVQTNTAMVTTVMIQTTIKRLLNVMLNGLIQPL